MTPGHATSQESIYSRLYAALGLTDSIFQIWITLTFAVLVATYVGEQRFDRKYVLVGLEPLWAGLRNSPHPVCECRVPSVLLQESFDQTRLRALAGAQYCLAHHRSRHARFDRRRNSRNALVRAKHMEEETLSQSQRGCLTGFHHELMHHSLMHHSLSLGVAAILAACAVPRSAIDDEHGVVTYYDRNRDGRVDFELHEIPGTADAAWALSDTKFRGRYDVRLKYGYVFERERVDLPVPQNVQITPGRPPVFATPDCHGVTSKHL